MKVLILQHCASEGPGTIGSFLSSRGVGTKIIRLYDGVRIPSNAFEFDGIISMGGPMNVYEEEKYPFLRDETYLLKRAMQLKIPILGVCLGAQMIAKAAGAKVVRSPKEEIGWFNIGLTEVGRSDRLLLGLPSEFEVFQWHGDMFEIPKGGGLLASSALCPHQALRFGSAYGLQFHVEVTREMLSEWFSGTPQQAGILKRMDEIEPQFLACANLIFRNFFSILKNSTSGF